MSRAGNSEVLKSAKRVFVFLLLGLLFNCGSNDVEPFLILKGLVVNDDTGISVPLPNSKIKVEYMSAYSLGNPSVIEKDSTTTDSNGKYVFKKADKDNHISRYVIYSGEDFLKKCSSSITIPTLSVVKVGTYLDTIILCTSGKLRLICNKVNPNKDSLIINCTVLSNSFTRILQTKIIGESKELTDEYIVKSNTSIEYKFSYKKEDGSITTGPEVKKTIPPKVTTDITIDF